MGKVLGLTKLARYYVSFFNSDMLKLLLQKPSRSIGSNREHVEAAIAWLCRAQDAAPGDGGVARSYSLVYHPYFDQKGWIASYPETTGYIIPTMFDYARITGVQEYFDRAVRMADWEMRVQLADGAVQGGTIDQRPSPAVFNTGQVIFGWLRAHGETGDRGYLDAAVRAGRFLCEVQSEDGAWRKKLSDYAGGSEMEYYTYNTRTAWALLALAQKTDPEKRFSKAAVRNIEFALGQQLDNGWFLSNCLNKPAEPLVHTIAYCIRGILEAGLLCNNDHYLQRARTSADALLSLQRDDGSLAGRYDRDWRPTVNWSCLTGNAQTSIIWAKLYRLTGEGKYLHGLRHLNTFLKHVQLYNFSNPALNGGICGSHPVNGRYGNYEILNWAVKFFIDALLLEDLIDQTISVDTYDGPHS